MKNYKDYPEDKYKKIIQSVGSLQYCIFNSGETMPVDIFSNQLQIENYNCVVAGTGCFTSDYRIELICAEQNKVQELIIPEGDEVVVIRLLRYDKNHGEPHYNANDQIIFPTKSGKIVRLFRKDAPDHYIKIAENSGIVNIADAYNLPEEKNGPVEKYNANGAKLQLEVIHQKDKKFRRHNT